MSEIVEAVVVPFVLVTIGALGFVAAWGLFKGLVS